MQNDYTLSTSRKDSKTGCEVPAKVMISPSTNYGYFDKRDGSEGGGLWFDADKRLTDYDGVFDLAPAVIAAIRELGYIVPRSFEAH